MLFHNSGNNHTVDQVYEEAKTLQNCYNKIKQALTSYSREKPASLNVVAAIRAYLINSYLEIMDNEIEYVVH